MNKKKYYSLTANQRKALRAEEQAKINKKLGLQTKTTEKATVDGAIEVAQKKPNRLWILITAITVGVLLIVTAIILPIVLLSNNSKYPIATIYLNDGRKINLEIWEDSCPITATNFIFLANTGFFDNTLLYDAQNNFTRFGATTEYGKTRYKDKNFIDTVTNFGLSDIMDTYKDSATANMFGYKLRPDYNSKDNARSNQRGVISYIFKNTADFMINVCPEGETNSAFYSQNEHSQKGNRENFEVRAFGQVRDEKSLKILESIYASEKNLDPGVEYYVATVPQIKITKIRVTNLDKNKWNKFVFVKYMNTAYNEGSAWSGWNAN